MTNLRDKTWLTIEEAAAYLDVCEASIRRWIAEKSIPHKRWGGPGGTVRINRVLLDQQDDSQRSPKPRTGEPMRPGQQKKQRKDEGVSLAAFVGAR